MKVNFKNLDRTICRVIKEMGRLADEEKVPAYVVGGFVRDIFLRKKNFDLDVAVEGNAIALAKLLAKKKNIPLTVYNQFGTATLKYQDKLLVDLASTRKENYARPGALPDVRPGSLLDDLIRRDFTINSIAVSINQARFEECVDPYGGVKDIRGKQIRILHKKSFVDDPTRILRAVRFEQRFNFKIEKQTLNLMKTALNARLEKNVKPARYFNEFRKILKEPSPTRSIERLSRLKGLDFFEEGFRPSLKILRKTEKNVSRLKKKDFYREKKWSLVYLMALFAGMDRHDLERVIWPLQLTSAERDSLLVSLQAREIIRKLKREKVKPSYIYQVLKPMALEIVYFIRAWIDDPRIERDVDKYLQQYRKIKLSVTGDDLKKHGIVPGERMGVVLETLLFRKIDGEIKNRQDELKAIKKFI